MFNTVFSPANISLLLCDLKNIYLLYQTNTWFHETRPRDLCDTTPFLCYCKNNISLLKIAAFQLDTVYVWFYVSSLNDNLLFTSWLYLHVFSDGIPGWGCHGRGFPASDGQPDPSLALHGRWLWTAKQVHQHDFQKIVLNTTLVFLSHQPHSPLTPPSLFYPTTHIDPLKKYRTGFLKATFEAILHKSQ